MYAHILVPVALDSEDKGLAALEVADRLLDEGGRITLLHVQGDIPGFAKSYIPADAFEAKREEARKALEKLAAKTVRRTEVVVATGPASHGIVDYAVAHDADCIVLASHQPEIADYLIGSTAAWVARHAGCAVHIIR